MCADAPIHGVISCATIGKKSFSKRKAEPEIKAQLAAHAVQLRSKQLHKRRNATASGGPEAKPREPAGDESLCTIRFCAQTCAASAWRFLAPRMDLVHFLS